ncbi:MAG TPA: hypothetical protein VFN88_03995 [Caulobacteraceae bacterium]|nr:hypothetical protein [Caulobacteraceae bacterium]
MKKLVIFAAALAAVAAPALAGTLDEVVKNGIVIDIQGTQIDVKYTPDGKFTAMDGQITGEWKIDGDKLCSNSNFDPTMNCIAYPKDKKPGDTFDLSSEQGTATVTIKKAAAAAPAGGAGPPATPAPAK